MMSGIIIEKLNNKFAKYLVFSTTTESPLFALEDISNQVSLVDGDMLIFVYLLQTGDAENRFIALTYQNSTFDFSTIKHIQNDKIDNEIRNKVADYLRANVILLKYSILLSKQKECILNGGII